TYCGKIITQATNRRLIQPYSPARMGAWAAPARCGCLRSARASSFPPPTGADQMDATITQLFDLTGRVAVVTGAGSGLGRAMAKGLSRAGARVAVSDINPQTAAETAEMIQAAGGAAISTKCDTREPAEIMALFDASDTAFGGLDILINNAGIGSHMHPEDLSLEEWQNVLSVNITGYFLCA